MTMRANFPLTADAPTFTAPRPITPHASNVIRPGRAIWAGAGGTATLIFDDGTTATDFPLIDGLNPIGGVVRVATGGTATGLWAID
jgi:hypothetical protein